MALEKAIIPQQKFTSTRSSQEQTNACCSRLRDLEAIQIDISVLKSFVLQNFPNNSPVRNIILAERETLGIHEFLAKMETWLKLLKVT